MINGSVSGYRSVHRGLNGCIELEPRPLSFGNGCERNGRLVRYHNG
eukprot:CAMPEP_0119513318 /NCGR_PEP_ID=MMETSP1344-20130328/31461_1 /TAXON_ID=236787 /ORGANISM="Florenciella parvula, Strain CCMP2471" /LENGTH=45 /DNA_ID= /DNA_START= /DNA_END= /DNA_ORIENTATION=